MLGISSKKPAINEETAAKVNSDLIVHNMPDRTRLEGMSTPKLVSGAQFLPAGVENNFKAVGGLIVGLGIIFVGTLVYLSYRFIIKPQINPPVPIVQAPASNNEIKEEQQIEVATTTEENLNSSSTPVVEGSANVFEIENGDNTIATSTAGGENNDEFVPGEEILNLPPISDTDSDGLNDEEETVLGTSISLADSDSDGFSDLSEIKNGYNPNDAKKKLYPNELATQYKNSVGKYEIYYPVAWNIKSLNNDYTTIISAPDNSLIQISVQDNANIQGIMSWYESTFSGETITYDRLKNGESWEGIFGADGLNFYLTDKKRENIYVISYIPSISGRLVYSNIFQMIVNSFKTN